MNDLISRQAAVDKINERQRKLIYCFGFDNDMVKIMDIAKSIVIAIPSAQPEQRWIPCGEQLPEDEKDVLVTRHFMSDKQLKENAITEALYVEVASRMYDEWTSYSDEYKIKRHLHKVIAWMPLPEPYEERREE